MEPAQLPKLDNNYYLYNCNNNRDIENNIGEIVVPEFNMKHINRIDVKYKSYLSQTYAIYEHDVNKMNDLFELNELFIEHEDNIKHLTNNMIEYNSIKSLKYLTTIERINAYMLVKSNKLSMYFKKILPVIQNDEDNLESVKVILSNMSHD
jgi:hypothetical protein